MTIEEINESIAFDHRPTGPDGCSAMDRIAFVGQVFGLDTVDLTIPYDFSTIIEEDDPIVICAAKHLALLKLDYLNRLYDHYHLDRETYDALSASLILAVRRIEHHLGFAEQGLPTPPFAAF